MAQWYIFENEVTVGPFEDGEMVRLASGGRLGAETPVRRGVDGAWTTWGVASSSGVAGEAELPSAEIISEQDGELKFACPGCRQRYRGATAEYRGAELECGSCGIRFRVPADGEYCVMFNSRAQTVVQVDGELAFRREPGSIVPSFHRAPWNQSRRMFLKQGGHELEALVQRVPDGQLPTWVIGVGYGDTLQWVPDAFLVD